MSDTIKVLVVSNVEWSDENSFGNTISNWFAGIDCFQFFSIYSRGSLPHNGVCDSYYSVSPKSLFKNFLQPEKIGNDFLLHSIKYNGTHHTEKKLTNFVHIFSKKIMSNIENLIFSTKRWKNKKFLNYIKNSKPDIVFCFAKSSSFISSVIQETLRQIPNCKLVSFISDDILQKQKKESVFNKKINYIIHNSSLVYGASSELCIKYSSIYNKKITPLFKSCSFEHDIKEKTFHSDTITILYAGNLLYGRAITLKRLAKSIKDFNSKNTKQFKLDVYTSTRISRKLFKQIECTGACKIHSSEPYNTIKELMFQSDLVLHVESFKRKQIKIVKYSFSTKIVDCLQSNSVFLAIGPKDVASISYASSIPGAFVCHDCNDLYDVLKEISESQLFENAIKTNEFAKKNHSNIIIKNHLIDSFEKLL